MPRAVVILGAGASAPFNVPTLAHLFKDPFAQRHLQIDTTLRDHLRNLFWGPRGHTLESSHLTVTVEDILTILRDYENYQRPIPPLLGTPADRATFRRSLYVLIKKAVYDGKSSRGAHLNALINHARQAFEHTTWASFNWDCIFESSFWYSSGEMPGARTNPSLVVPVRNWRAGITLHTFLKLHGGVNWWHDGTDISYLPFGFHPDLNARWAEYAQGKAQGHPVILEPSCYKYADPSYRLLEPQWDRFVDDLIVADLVCIVGYSLPEADAMARTALTVGFQSGKTNARWIVVNKNEGICDRYSRVFGTVKLRTLRLSLEEFSRDIPGNLALP